MEKKLFISHASEDKDDFVRPLAEALRTDFEVWYDEYQLVIGCSLLEEISKGLVNSDFGVVVLSKHFFAKNWPQQELNGLFALEEKDKKVILPVWKDVSREDVKSYSPILADRVAAKAEDGVDKVVNDIKKAVAFSELSKSVEKPANELKKLLRESIDKKREKERSEDIVGSNEGVGIAWNTAKQTIAVLANQIRPLSDIGLRIDGPRGNEVQYIINIWIGKIILHAEYWNNITNSAAWALLSFYIGHAKGNDWNRKSEIVRHETESYSLYVDMSDNRLWRSERGQLLTPEQVVNVWFEKLSSRIVDK